MLHEARRHLKEEMIGMVSDTLKKNAPNEEFAERVFQMLSRYPERHHSPGHGVLLSTLKDLEAYGKSSLDGIHRALASPHWPTRAFTAKALRNLKGIADDDLEPLLKQAVRDNNRHVRRLAASALLDRAQSKRKRKDLIPVIASLLLDPSNHVRRIIARKLCRPNWTLILPVEAVSEALLQAPNPKTRDLMERLLRQVLESHRKGEP